MIKIHKKVLLCNAANLECQPIRLANSIPDFMLIILICDFFFGRKAFQYGKIIFNKYKFSREQNGTLNNDTCCKN